MLTDGCEKGLGVRVLGSFDWGNPSDCGMLLPSFLVGLRFFGFVVRSLVLGGEQLCGELRLMVVL